PARQRALDLPEVRRVVVDVFGVLHMNAVLLLELVQRRVAVARLVVNVERPVGEVQGLGELVRRRRRLRARPATGGEKAGKREDRAARGGPLQQLSAGVDVGHSGSSSMESTTKVDSGFQ